MAAGVEQNTSLQVPGQERSVPAIALNDAVGGAKEIGDAHRPRSAPGSSRSSQQKESEDGEEQYESPPASPLAANFTPLNTSIETGGFEDPFEDHLTFSKRGSVLLDGQKAFFDGSKTGSVMSKKSPMSSSKSSLLGVPQRSPSTAEKRLSQKVRSMYEGGATIEEADEGLGIDVRNKSAGLLGFQKHTKAESTDKDTLAELPKISSPSHGDLAIPGRNIHGRPGDIRASYVKMEPWEAAGGIEDYHEVSIGDVDRYGFIRPSTARSHASSRGSHAATSEQGGRASLHRNRAEEGSVRNGRLHKPPPSSYRPHRLSLTSNSMRSSRPSSRATSNAPSALTSWSHRSRPGSVKHRRWADEAPDMLRVQPGMPQSPQTPQTPAEAAKHKVEQRRVEKWEKMARQLSSAQKSPKHTVGGGQVFAFDMTHPKLVERVWKGIPDVWRAPAWHSFLTASSKTKNRANYVHDHVLVERYHLHQEQESLDDIQIDMDVPRTIGQHVMFRARYRGGQRLLFRVLRALALEYPETGYVQGMAPLAATLLCYFDEERAFVCACRLWTDRGLAELFAPGFGSLMSALNVFETKWLAENKIVKKQLEELGIPATSYGTKWYLTLFNYALPFEAQLRVWDVFILLGGSPQHEFASGKLSKPDDEDDGRFDILHAVAAAMIDALQETLVDAEFENAMSALTGHVNVANEDILMRVTKREYEERQRRRRKGR